MESGHTPRQIFTKYLLRPFKMLLGNPIVFAMSSLMSIMYNFIYLFYSTLPFVFGKQYRWNETQTGMSYLRMAIGLSLAGLFIVYFGSDRISEALTEKYGSPSAEVLSCLALLTAGSVCVALLGTVPFTPWPNDLWVEC